MDKNLVEQFDASIEGLYEPDLRTHLGASVIGQPCARSIWYSWRWALKEQLSGRMIRLFDRGHKEEHRFEKWLKPLCDEFWPLDPSTGEQIRISDFYGYFGGSLDGVIRNPFDLKGDYLTEFKTHNDKSFSKLKMKGVKEAKPEHYIQMQIYLHYKSKLKAALYFAINKNDDEVYIELVERDEQTAIEALEKTRIILSSSEPPPRMEKASENHYYCKYFCDYKDVCFSNKIPMKSCRSCDFCKTSKKGFTCAKQEKVLTKDEQINACDLYERKF